MTKKVNNQNYLTVGMKIKLKCFIFLVRAWRARYQCGAAF